MRQVRLRLALAPTGHLTLNAARVALANALFARATAGAEPQGNGSARVHLTLRLDDLDQERARPAFAEAIQRDLTWIGVTADETLSQADRLPVYAQAIAALRASGRLYPCFESAAELRAKSEQRRRRGKPDIYDRGMLKLTQAQRTAAEAGGKRPHWRFRLSGDSIDWTDRILGRQSAKLTSISDPILVNPAPVNPALAEGADMPAPLLASAIDDRAMNITDLIRGEENAADTAVRLDLMAALATGPLPRIASVPALDGANRTGRKQGNRPLRDLRGDGVLAPSLSAWLTGGGGDAHGFRLERLRDIPDPLALLALNRQALATTPFAAIVDRLPPNATEPFWLAIRGEIDLLRDAALWWDVVAGDPPPPPMQGDSETLQHVLALLPPEPWNTATWQNWTEALPPAAADALYRALTGEDSGPAMPSLLPMIGRERARRRLLDALG